MALSPLGKTPVLKVDETPIFESAVILEYLEDTGPNPLHPRDPLRRAQHRAWIEFGSAILNDIAGFYGAPDAASFEAKQAALRAKFERVEQELRGGPYFEGEQFSLVDAVYGPVFRYFEKFDTVRDFGILKGLPKLQERRAALSQRKSVREAVKADYQDRLRAFLRARRSYLSTMI